MLAKTQLDSSAGDSNLEAVAGRVSMGSGAHSAVAWGRALGRGVGIGAAAVLGLVLARAWLPGVLWRFAATMKVDKNTGITPEFAGQELGAAANYGVSFVQAGALYGSVAAAAAAVLAYLAIEQIVRKIAGESWLRIVRAGGAALALGVALSTSAFVGLLAALLILTLSTVLVALEPAAESGAGSARPAAFEREHSGHALWVGYEALAGAWGAWITLPPRLALPGVIGFFIVGGWRIARAWRAPDREEALARDSLTGLPLVGMPLLGLLRSPSALWLLGAVALGLALRTLRRHYPALRNRIHPMVAIAGPWAVAAMFIVPMKFRELPSVDLWEHESQHLGWINSALDGKLLMADASMIYGPLREYFLAGFAGIFGASLETVRVAHVATNLLGVAALLSAGWIFITRRKWLHAGLAYLAIVNTPAAFYVLYRVLDRPSPNPPYRAFESLAVAPLRCAGPCFNFGWADTLRSTLPALALAGTLHALCAIPISGAATRAQKRRLVAWAAFAGVCVLYSQEFGIAAIAGAFGAICIDALRRNEHASPRQRLARAVSSYALYGLGVLAPLALFVGVYALCGRAGLLFRSLRAYTVTLATGSWSATAHPITADTFSSAAKLLGDAWSPNVAWRFGGGPALEYVGPALVCCVAAVVLASAFARGQWTARSTMLLGLTLFSLAALRHSVLRTDLFHVFSGGAPSLLVLLALAEMASEQRVSIGGRLLPVGAALVCIAGVGWAAAVRSPGILEDKLARVIRRDEQPSRGEPYVYPDVPRAGDVWVSPQMLELVRHVRTTTKPQDPVLSMLAGLSGGVVNFMADRRNPTRFDTPHEVITFENQREVLDALTRDPPVLIVGSMYSYVGPEVIQLVQRDWALDGTFGGVSVVRHAPKR